MICAQCGQMFVAKNAVQRYCSPQCRADFRKQQDVRRNYPPTTFVCGNPKCRKTVETATDRLDKRTRFCSRECEKAYWRHPPKKSHIRNWHSIEEYESYERRTSEY